MRNQDQLMNVYKTALKLPCTLFAMNNSSSPTNTHADTASLTQTVAVFSCPSRGIALYATSVKVACKRGRPSPPSGAHGCLHYL